MLSQKYGQLYIVHARFLSISGFLSIFGYFTGYAGQERPAITPMQKCKRGYPYSHMNYVDKFEETRLPPRKAFDNDLTGEAITQENMASIRYGDHGRLSRLIFEDRYSPSCRRL